MRQTIKTIVRWLIQVLPDKPCRLLFPLFIRVIDADKLENTVLSRFTDRLIRNYDSIVKKIVSHRKAMIISKMVWDGTYFNIAVLDNLLGLVVYCLYLGYIPIISINEDDENAFSWGWYFKQPLGDIASDVKIKSYKTLSKERVGFISGWFFDQSGESYDRWSFLYKTFTILNEKTREYIDSENKVLGDLENVLGVLMRGTDYISLKPKGHPIQPNTEDVINKTQELMNNNKYRAIYMATDDETYFDAFTGKFGSEKVLSNKRVYYDKKYIPGDLIGRVHFDRDNDNYKKGLEYLSSMVLLSRCGSLVAGNCGGTKFALLYTDKPFEDCIVFNKGLY